MRFAGKLSKSGAFVADVSGTFTSHHKSGIQDWRGRLEINPDAELVAGAEYDLTLTSGRSGRIIIESIQPGGGPDLVDFRINSGLP